MRAVAADVTVQFHVRSSFLIEAVQPVVERLLAARTSAVNVPPGSAKFGACWRGIQMSGAAPKRLALIRSAAKSSARSHWAGRSEAFADMKLTLSEKK